MIKFEELGLNSTLLEAIQEAGFVEPSEIQAKTIPLVIKGQDVMAGAATGSGKTLAFSAGILQEKATDGIQGLILTPTRELAVQVANEIKRFSQKNPKRVIAVYGGVAIGPQIDRLGTADVVVGTPGRLLDHLERGTMDLSQVKTLVLDEADRMLDMGFIDDVKRIMDKCPSREERQTLLFTATLCKTIKDIGRQYMNNPENISVKSYIDPSLLKQIYYDIDKKQKFSLLVHLLQKERSKLIMVFCNTKRNTDFVAKNLKLNGIDALAIHGGFTQNKRTTNLKKFHSNQFRVLVCTDVAARGLDIKGVTHVYNYDIPRESKQYVHRIGRTARAGKYGVAINLLARDDHEFYSAVLRDNKEVKIDRKDVPEFQRAKINVQREGHGRNFKAKRNFRSKGQFHRPKRR